MDARDPAAHPCLRCGACCAHFRASFYWAEADDAGPGGVPVALTRQLTPHRRVMIGTEGPAPRCGWIAQRVDTPIAPSSAMQRGAGPSVPIEGALSRNTDIDQLCFCGNGLKQPIMLVALTPEAMKKPREEVEQALAADIDHVNAELEPHEKIAKCVIVDEPWTVDNNLMTPTMKVKRNQVEDKYGEVLAREAQVRNKVAWES